MDEIEYGNSGLVSVGEGWLKDSKTGNLIDPEGKVYDKEMNLIFDPYDEEEK